MTNIFWHKANVFVYAFLPHSVLFLNNGRGLERRGFNVRIRRYTLLNLYEVSHCGSCNYFGVSVAGLDREDADAAAAAEDARVGLDAAVGGGAEEVYGEVNRDGACVGLDDGVDGESGGRVEERDDRAAVQDAAHPRQLLAHVEGEGGGAARRADELQPEQVRVRHAREGLAQPRQLFG